VGCKKVTATSELFLAVPEDLQAGAQRPEIAGNSVQIGEIKKPGFPAFFLRYVVL